MEKNQRKVHILVATSGDTGSAIANGFFNIKNIHVTILFPKGKVSEIQQKQLTTNGGNITAIEINGTFDDCQRLVKCAFLDEEVNKVINLSSANSINIARLMPQSLYYWWAWVQLQKKNNLPLIFCTPSGNFGNLCGGLIAQNMGMPVEQFIAATNLNDVVPKYFSSGVFTPRASVQTISNAMDVGNPSNFPRMTSLYSNDFERITANITSTRVTEEETKTAIKKVFDQTGYLMCPHTAVGYHALTRLYSKEQQKNKVLLSTAHPSKFKSVIEETIGSKVEIPIPLANIIKKEEKYLCFSDQYEEFKSYILELK